MTIYLIIIAGFVFIVLYAEKLEKKKTSKKNELCEYDFVETKKDIRVRSDFVLPKHTVVLIIRNFLFDDYRSIKRGGTHVELVDVIDIYLPKEYYHKNKKSSLLRLTGKAHLLKRIPLPRVSDVDRIAIVSNPTVYHQVPDYIKKGIDKDEDWFM